MNKENAKKKSVHEKSDDGQNQDGVVDAAATGWLPQLSTTTTREPSTVPTSPAPTTGAADQQFSNKLQAIISSSNGPSSNKNRRKNTVRKPPQKHCALEATSIDPMAGGSMIAFRAAWIRQRQPQMSDPRPPGTHAVAVYGTNLIAPAPTVVRVGVRAKTNTVTGKPVEEGLVGKYVRVLGDESIENAEAVYVATRRCVEGRGRRMQGAARTRRGRMVRGETLVGVRGADRMHLPGAGEDVSLQDFSLIKLGEGEEEERKDKQQQGEEEERKDQQGDHEEERKDTQQQDESVGKKSGSGDGAGEGAQEPRRRDFEDGAVLADMVERGRGRVVFCAARELAMQVVVDLLLGGPPGLGVRPLGDGV